MCYYDRNSNAAIEDLLYTYPILKDMDFKCISATSKNLSKLQKANIKTVDDLFSEWLDARHHEATPFIHAYINTNHSYWVDFKDLNRLGINVIHGYSARLPYLATPHSWGNIHDKIKTNFDPKVAQQYMEKCDKNIKLMKAVEYQGVNLYDHLDWDTTLRDKLGVNI